MKKMYPRHLYLFFVLICFFLSFSIANKVIAQEIGIKISPIKIDELIKPGDVISRTIKVTNASPISKTFYLFLSDFEADGETGKAKLIPAGTSEIGLSKWVTVSTEGYDFRPGEQKEIPITINVPNDASPGGHYGAVEVGTQPPKVKVEGEDKGAAISMAQRTACLFLFQVAGDVDENADVREFTTDKTFYGTPFDIKFIVRIENKGNTHIKPQGAINVKNIFGKNVAIVRVNASNANVLRNSIRRFEQEWSDKWAFGRYKAILGLTYGTETSLGGQGKKTLYSEKTFWIIPWKIVVPALLVIALIIAFMAFLLNLYKNKAIKRAMEQMGARQRPYSKNYGKRVADNNLAIKLSIVTIIGVIIVLIVYFIFFA